MENKNKKTKRVFFLWALPWLLGAAFFFFPVLAWGADLEKDIVDLTNQERAAAGLGQLSRNSALDQAALFKAEDMAKDDYFAHTSPSGKEPWDWFDRAGYDYKYAGENLAMDFKTAAAVHRAWMKSPTHRENILSENYTEIGVAVIDGKINGKETKIAVQLFGKPVTTALHDSALKELNEPAEIRSVTLKQNQDNLLVYVETWGGPDSAKIKTLEDQFELEKIALGKFVGLVSDFQNEDLTLLVSKENQPDLVQKISQAEIEARLQEGSNFSSKLQTTISSSSFEDVQNRKNRFRAQNILLAFFALVFFIVLFSIWSMEKEDRLLIQKMGQYFKNRG